MNKELEKLKKEVTTIKLTAQEERVLRFSLDSYKVVNPLPKKSPWQLFHIRYALVPLLILISVSVPLANASTAALPGDLLYPIKTDILEEINSFFILDNEREAIYHSGLVEKRVKEVARLIAKDEENFKAIFEAHEEIEESVAELLSSLNKVNQDEKINLSARLTSIIGAYQDLIKDEETNIVDNEKDTLIAGIEDENESAHNIFEDTVEESIEHLSDEEIRTLIEEKGGVIQNRLDDLKDTNDSTTLQASLERTSDYLEDNNLSQALREIIESSEDLSIQTEIQDILNEGI